MMLRATKFIVSVISNLLNPNKLPVCRFVPSCSAYADEALDKHGVFRGFGLTVVRVFKCHPWGKSGLDPVPGAKVHVHERCS